MRNNILAVVIAGISTSAMADQPEYLERNLVTATCNDMSTNDAPSNVTVITKEEIEAREGDSSTMIRKLPIRGLSSTNLSIIE